jgi:hypothetical protein
MAQVTEYMPSKLEPCNNPPLIKDQILYYSVCEMLTIGKSRDKKCISTLGASGSSLSTLAI